MSGRSLAIVTPEGITFSLPLAGPVSRFLAWLVDLCAIGVLSLVARQLAGVLGVFGGDLMQALTMLLYFAVSIGYGIATEWYLRGQTLGKRLLDLRVVDAAGLKLTPAQVIVRNLLRTLDALPAFYAVGGAACLLSPKRQRLGDLLAGTVVVRTARVAPPDLEKLIPGAFNSLAAHALASSRLRQRISPEEAALALSALIRRDLLEPAARLALFARLASHFRGLVSLPEEAVEGLSDEQLVRNVVGILYGRGKSRQSDGEPPRPVQGLMDRR